MVKSCFIAVQRCLLFCKFKEWNYCYKFVMQINKQTVHKQFFHVTCYDGWNDNLVWYDWRLIWYMWNDIVVIYRIKYSLHIHNDNPVLYLALFIISQFLNPAYLMQLAEISVNMKQRNMCLKHSTSSCFMVQSEWVSKAECLEQTKIIALLIKIFDVFIKRTHYDEFVSCLF